MKKAFLAVVLLSAVAVGCESTDTGNDGGNGGTPIIGPLTWTVSAYTVVSDDCEAVNPTEPLTAFELTIDIDGETATLESVDLVVPGTGEPLGGIALPYAPTDDPVVFTSTSQDGPTETPDCVVDLSETFTVDLDDPTVSIDQNSTVQVTWDHEEVESPDSASPGACDGAWFVDLPCTSQATFTMTQDPPPTQ